MCKKIFKFISLTLVFCMLNSSVLFAAESGALKNMTYEEWLVEQEGVDSTAAIVQSELEPVKVTSQKQEQESNIPQIYNAGKSGNKLLDSILKEKGNYKLNEEIDMDLKAKNITASITIEEEAVSEVDSSSETDTVSEVDSSSETDTVSEVDSTSETDTVSEVDSTSEEDTVSEVDSTSEEDTVSEVDSTSEADTVSEVDSTSEEDTVSEVDSTDETDTVSEIDSTSKEDTVSEVDSSSKVNSVNKTDEANLENNSALIRTAPTAGLVPVIINEESLVNGEITTDTLIAFLFNDTDADGHTIVNRYVDGTAVNYIVGSIDGGFVIQITDPGSYQLYYQVEDSAGEFSRVLGFAIDVIKAPVIEPYQVFEGSFSSANDTVTYNFSIDFSKMSSAAVCLVRKGYVGTNIEVLDESGNQVLLRETDYRQAKDWGFIDKPSYDATICNYTVVAKPKGYSDRASDYRIVIGNKNDTELMMSGIENTVLVDQYYEAKVNLQNSAYVPNVGEYWFKYKRESTSVITILSDASDIRFKLFDANLDLKFESAKNSDTHRTSFIGTGWISAEKARLTTIVGEEYYLVVYSTNPNTNLSLRAGSMGTAVGNPILKGGNASIISDESVTLKEMGYSTSVTCTVSGDDLPNTAQVREVDLNVSPTLATVERWRIKAPAPSSWVSNPSSYWNSIDMNYKLESSGNAELKGTWNADFLASNYGKGKTIMPSYNFFFNYEYGD